ncbi:hypothetical protein AC579_9508 [Pseudocercospora musae]|uniref:Uncharacterized protein n=1 Tax=Pseudocercospora musae TaxID=113226 RepID=A0A139IMW8_9PEZI|nr:hypothetical protein AC579_9508 [Pseudocercospora musae]
MDQTPKNRRRPRQADIERRSPAHTWTRRRHMNGTEDGIASADSGDDLGQISPRDMNRLQRRSRAVAAQLATADLALSTQPPSRCRNRPANSAIPSRNRSSGQVMLTMRAHAGERRTTAAAPLTNPSNEAQAVEIQAPQSPLSKSGKKQASKEKK